MHIALFRARRGLKQWGNTMSLKSLTEKRSFLVLLVALGVIFAILLSPFYIPLFLAAIFNILFYPVYSKFLKFFKGRAYLASFVVTLLIFLMIVLPSGILVGIMVNQSVDLVNQLNSQEFFTDLGSHQIFQSYLSPWVKLIEAKIGINLDLPALILKVGKELAFYVYNFSPQVLLKTAGFFFSFFVMHFSMFFFFVEGPNIVQAILDLSPIEARYESKLAIEFKNMIYATIYGYLLTALIQAILAGIGFAVAGISAPLVFACLTFFMSMVPLIGATAVWLPLSIWVYIQGEAGWALFLFLYGALLISGIDNIIKPMIMRGKANIHILLIFFSLMGGINLFGPIGILFGPVITAMFLACVRIYRSDFIKPVS